MTKQRVAVLGTFINTIIFSSYYLLIKGTLVRWNPIAFVGIAALPALPIGIGIVIACRKDITRYTLKWGVVVGIAFALAFVGLNNALRYTTATETAYFSCLNGIIAGIILWLMGKPVAKVTWAMACLSVGGMTLLVLNAPLLVDHWRGDVDALIAIIIYVGSTFLLDGFLAHKPTSREIWAMSGVACVALALTAGIVMLFFGDWSIQAQFPQDAWSLIFVGIFVLVLPMIFSAFGQQQVGGAKLVFIYILEPILADLGAIWFLHEHYPLLSYLGAALGICAVLGQAFLPELLERFALPRAEKEQLSPDVSRVSLVKPSGTTLMPAQGAVQYQVVSKKLQTRKLNKRHVNATRVPYRWPMI